MGKPVPVTRASVLNTARRLLRTPPAEIVGRFTQRMSAVSERLFSPPTAAALSRPQRSTDIFAALMSGRSTWMFAEQTSPAQTVARLRDAVPSDEMRVRDAARRVVGGELPVLGHGWLAVGSPPRWTREPLANLDTPRGHWSRIRYLDRAVAGDHKVLWEFNRHQHLVTLAQAWQYSHAPELLETIQQHFRSWLQQNPQRHGANWASSLEVAYRSISWCWTFRMLSGADTQAVLNEQSLADQLLASVDAHGRHVARYLSTWFSPNTHLTGEALGLLYLGICFPALSDAEKWRTLGRGILESEIEKQVRADGVYFEQATQYHRYTAEIYVHYLLLMRSSGGLVPEKVLDAVNRLFDVLLALVRSDGSMALLGDDDGGRLLQLDDRPPDDLRALLGIGAVVLGRHDLAWAGRDDDAALLWFLGPDARDRRDALVAQPPAETAKAFVDGGVFTMRDQWRVPSGHVTISCGPHGALSCGHAHADALSVELFAASGPLLVDKGTLVYDGPERNEFRSTAAHNTLELGGQAAAEPGGPFRWQSSTDAVLDGWTSEEGMAWFTGHHDGYARLYAGRRHARSVWHPASGVWYIEDTAAHVGDVDFALRWHLAPGVTTRVVRSWTSGALLELLRADAPVASLLLVSSVAGVCTVDRDRVSPQYGRRIDTSTVRWSGTAGRDLRVRSVVMDWQSLPVNGITIRGIPTVGEVAVHRPGVPSDPSVSSPVLHLDPLNTAMPHGLMLTATSSWYEPGTSGRTERICAIGARSVVLGAEHVVASESPGNWMTAQGLSEAWTHVATGNASRRVH